MRDRNLFGDSEEARERERREAQKWLEEHGFSRLDGPSVGNGPQRDGSFGSGRFSYGTFAWVLVVLAVVGFAWYVFSGRAANRGEQAREARPVAQGAPQVRRQVSAGARESLVMAIERKKMEIEGYDAETVAVQRAAEDIAFVIREQRQAMDAALAVQNMNRYNALAAVYGQNVAEYNRLALRYRNLQSWREASTVEANRLIAEYNGGQ